MALLLSAIAHTCERPMMKWFTQAIACALILGLVCLKYCRNLGISTFSGC